jgi:hypothetical protein
MERTKDRFEEGRDPETPVDYFVVSIEADEWYVSREIAQFVEACLDQAPAPEWIAFVDLTGARVRVRARLILSVRQCSAEQRALARAFYRARRREAKADRDWEEDD